MPAEGDQDDHATRGSPAEPDAVPSGRPDAASERKSRLKPLVAFFDSTTKVLVAVGGLIAAIIALVAVITHVFFPPHSPTAMVPYVIGDTLSAAASELKADGFHNIPYLYDCYRSPDIDDVVQESPGAGALIVVTAPVQLDLQAKNCSTVPSVIGMNLSSAADALHGAGFSNIPWVDGCYGSSEIGAVVTQSPAAGASYGENRAVSLKLQAKNC